MIGAPGFLVVGQQVARNPVARAIARQRLASGVRDFSICLHLLRDGERVSADGVAAAKVLMVAFEVLHAGGLEHSPQASVIRGAISTIEQLALRDWRWRTQDATAIDAGLQRAQAVASVASAVDMQRAWHAVDRIDAHIAANRPALETAHA